MHLFKQLLISVFVPSLLILALFLSMSPQVEPVLAAPAQPSFSNDRLVTIQAPLTQTQVVTDVRTENPAADSEVDESAAPSPPGKKIPADPPVLVKFGELFTYTFSITNTGDGRATGVTFSDSLPAGVVLGSMRANRGECQGATDLTCSLGTLEPGMTATINIVVSPTLMGVISNTGRVTCNELDPDEHDNARTKIHIIVPSTYSGTLTHTLEVTETEKIDGTSNVYLPILFKE